MNKTLSGSLVETTEQERVRSYAKGWNDAQRGFAKVEGRPICYYIGYIDALRGQPARKVH
jgi:hypothetical protein